MHNFEKKHNTSSTLEGMVFAREYVKDSYNEFIDVMAMLGKSLYIYNKKRVFFVKVLIR